MKLRVAMLIRKTLNWEKRGDWRERAAASYIALLCLVWRENPWITYLGTKVHLMSTLKFSFEKENERKLAAMLEIFNSFRPVRLHLIFICNIINSNQNQPCKCMYFFMDDDNKVHGNALLNLFFMSFSPFLFSQK